MPNFTIIIPHYNIPNLLRRCLKSIPQREDTQVIVVDDCSSDICVSELKNNIEKEFPFVSFYYLSENGGGGKSRNEGLKYAKGKWLLFADADDFFNFCLSDFFDKYVDDEADVVFANASCVDSETYLPLHRTEHVNRHIALESTGDEQFLRYRFGEPWCKLIKRDFLLINNIRFQETSIHNDTLFSFMVGLHAKNIKSDIRCIYCVTSRPNSVSRALSESKKLERVRVFTNLLCLYRQNNLHFKPVMNYPYRQLAISRIENRNSFREEYKVMKDAGFSTFNIYANIFPDWCKNILKKLIKKHL